MGKLMRWVYFEIILPNVLRAHRWGLFEVLVWVGCWVGLAQGMLVTNAPDVAEMIALTASGLTIPALGYTTVLRGKRVSNDWMATLFQLFFAVGCFPWALHFRSTLYGVRSASAPLRVSDCPRWLVAAIWSSLLVASRVLALNSAVFCSIAWWWPSLGLWASAYGQGIFALR